MSYIPLSEIYNYFYSHSHVRLRVVVSIVNNCMRK